MLSGLDLIILEGVKIALEATTLVGVPIGAYTLGIGGLLIVNQIISIKVGKRGGNK